MRFVLMLAALAVAALAVVGASTLTAADVPRCPVDNVTVITSHDDTVCVPPR